MNFDDCIMPAEQMRQKSLDGRMSFIKKHSQDIKAALVYCRNACLAASEVGLKSVCVSIHSVEDMDFSDMEYKQLRMIVLAVSDLLREKGYDIDDGCEGVISIDWNSKENGLKEVSNV